MKLIDAEALKAEILKAPVWTGLDAIAKINTMPSIDIVRCKECKWASPNKEGDYDCKCHIPIFRVDAEGYCYLADRKESE